MLDTDNIEPIEVDSTEVIDDLERDIELAIKEAEEPTEEIVEEPLDDFEDVEPMRDFEIDNLKYHLCDLEGGKGIRLLDMAESGEHFNFEDGTITDEAYELAKECGLSDNQINAFRKRQIDKVYNTLDGIYRDAGLTANEGQELVRWAKESFTFKEYAIFERETKENPVESLKTLQRYKDGQ